MYVDKIYTCYGHVSSLISRGANLSQKGCIVSSNDSFIHKRLTTSADKLSTRTLVLRCPTQLDRRVTSCACGHIEKWNYTVCGGHNQLYFCPKDECNCYNKPANHMVVWGRAFATPVFKELLWFYRILQKFCLDALYETVHALTGPCAYVSRR